LTLKECELINKGNKEHQEQELINMSYAVINGIGCTFGDKKFKFINPYEKDRKETQKKQVTREQLLRDYEKLKQSFKKTREED
jgi:hypothetical protein